MFSTGFKSCLVLTLLSFSTPLTYSVLFVDDWVLQGSGFNSLNVSSDFNGTAALLANDEADYDSDKKVDTGDYSDDEYYDVDNSTLASTVTSPSDASVDKDGEFFFRKDNDEMDFSWLANYNISELEPSELFFPNMSKPGFWSVFDSKDVVDPNVHRRPPSCILARMLVSIELPDMMDFSDWSAALNSTTNRTLWVPPDAIASNQTCDPEHQILSLTWNHTLNGVILDRINLTMVFNQTNLEKDPGHFLKHISIAVYHKELTTANGLSDFVIEATNEVHLMEAPRLFAFCCKQRIEAPLNGTVTHFGLDSAEYVSSIRLSVVFNELCVEPFREGRYYEDLTHLKFSCINGWPYKLVPETVLVSLIIFTIVIAVAFTVKYKRRKLEMELAARAGGARKKVQPKK